ncbi:MAG: IS200/IS605 family transposase [Muribaculaceae bacterium]|nr:IS200/IS605 family transposase [Muribaculaceae bacterium]
MSHTRLTYHIIFAPWHRERVINEEHERELYMFIFNFATKRGAKVWRISGMPDHVHILCDIPAKIAVADFIRLIKSESSKFLAVNPHFPLWKKWAERYACVSVDQSLKDTRIRYIMNQKEHHRSKSFVDEYRDFMAEYGFDSVEALLGDDGC